MVRDFLSKVGPLGFLCQLAVAYFMLFEFNTVFTKKMNTIAATHNTAQFVDSELITYSMILVWVIFAMVVYCFCKEARNNWERFWDK